MKKTVVHSRDTVPVNPEYLFLEEHVVMFSGKV